MQAPKRRVEKHDDTADRRRLLPLVAFAALGVVALAAVVALLALTGKSNKSTGKGIQKDPAIASTMGAAGCSYLDTPAPKPPKGQQQHIATLADKVDWNTFPPAGGQHYGFWAVWGFYTDPVNPKQVVHNEEHGGVVLWWGPKVPKSEVEQLRSFYNSSPNSMFGTPLRTLNGRNLGSKIAVSAWTGDPRTYQVSNWGYEHLAVCPRFDRHAFTVFRNAYRGHGPEGIPTSLNNPGQGPG